ncbi:MAG: hypothetical protein AVDCRST_MAG19-1212 [uncultured Thermomicrobiales bacterium]|uniref:Uncharacterized protein n=1 Tax=uncultured Thermomicrobiales bacterium TaxID=1645740 RepID=A0A6J4UNX3_9BACT|nr:MAG: hypothetical protein AVDCRST_MAG19-1212 [uncultured Thermomicrobiales bacterium]
MEESAQRAPYLVDLVDHARQRRIVEGAQPPGDQEEGLGFGEGAIRDRQVVRELSRTAPPWPSPMLATTETTARRTWDAIPNVSSFGQAPVIS